jgi:glycerol-3-phosphate dehydrogenase
VAERAAREPELSRRLDPELPHILAQVDEAVDHEQAQTVDDVLGRRVPLLLRARDQGLGAAPAVAARMGKKLGWNAARVAAEVAAYQQVVAVTRRFRDA